MANYRAQRLRDQRGYSLIELLTNVALLAALAAATLPHVDNRRQDINTATEQLTSDYRWARVRAVSSGVHFQLKWTGSRTYQIERMKEVTPGTWATDQLVKQVTLPATIIHSAGLDRVEFNTRGMMISSTAQVLQILSDSAFGATRTLAIWPSGQTNAYS